MIRHTDLGQTSFTRLRALTTLVKNGLVTLGGHRPGKIYGRLNCRAGKRMKAENRVFFENDTEATTYGYRPCAVCLPKDYERWKAKS